MKEIIEKAQQDRATMILFALASFFVGLAAGLLISPIKKGIRLDGFNVSIGSGNGCNNKVTNPAIQGCCCEDSEEEK